MTRREISLSEIIQITFITENEKKEQQKINVTHDLGVTLMTTLLQKKLISGSFCGGRGTCGRCRLFDPLVKKLKFQKVVFENYDSTNSAASLKYVLNNITKGTLILNGDLFLTNTFQDSFETQIKRGVSQFLAQKILSTLS